MNIQKNCVSRRMNNRQEGEIKGMMDLEAEIQKLASAKSRPNEKITQIKEAMEEWKKESDKLIRVKAIIAEKIADKAVYDQLLVFLGLIISVLAIVVATIAAIAAVAEPDVAKGWLECMPGIGILALNIVVLAAIVWMCMRRKSDYYNELQVIVEELSRQREGEE